MLPLKLRGAGISIYWCWFESWREGRIYETGKRTVSGLPKTRNFKSAAIIETEPYGYTKQGKFLNTVYYIETLYTPEEFLDKLHQIENEQP